MFNIVVLVKASILIVNFFLGSADRFSSIRRPTVERRMAEHVPGLVRRLEVDR